MKHPTSSPGARGHLAQINVSPEGGVPKRRVAAAHVGVEQVAGDRQNDTAHHGGPTRAVSLYSAELIAALRSEGHPIAPGSAGENLTISGLDWARVVPGGRLRIGTDVELEITSYDAPCHKIAASFKDGGYGRISQKAHPGWSRLYARVVRTGAVREGDPVELLGDDFLE